MWETFVDHENIESIMHDKGLAKVGDGLVNFCYSLAKTLVLGYATGEKVRDSVLARAIRSTSVYSHMNRRTDAGRAGDAYEAIMAYLWMTEKISISDMVDSLSGSLGIDNATSRKKEGEIAAIAFQKFLECNIEHLP
ncbi:MAG: hypothetical protein E4H14_04505 [Candidatus Thorarchaeota archaeon]|nr:MAG: hypothetical protein E4H14_04505 [Candidatus Thorarchaeota archaeon]